MNDAHLVTPRTDSNLPPSTDPLTDVLQLLQMTGVLYCNAELIDPWGIEIPSIPGVMYVEVVTSGSCWLQMEDRQALFLPENSLVLIPRGKAHTLRGNPGDLATPLENIPVERLSERFEKMRFGGNGRQTNITYYGVRIDAYLASRLISFLPDVLHLRTLADSNRWLHSTIGFIAQEANTQSPGSETVITRLADVLVIQAIREWLGTARSEKQGWIAALHDRKIGAALSLMHQRPEYHWTVESLAREIGMSRSGFSARFTTLVGQSALNYLTELRVQLAYRELRNTTDSLVVIAQRVGYQSEPAFNRAFKRVLGTSPGKARKQ